VRYICCMTLDTLEYAKRLEAAGVERRQAEAQAEALRDVVATQLVTKQDLKEAVSELRAEMWKLGLAVILANTTLTTFVQ